MYFPCNQLYFLDRDLGFAILDVLQMSPWKWKFTMFLVLFYCASLTVVFRKSGRCRYCWQSKTRTINWYEFVEAPTAPSVFQL